ncbi:MAG: hypothetical protein V4450_07225 [Bacteroidota bacterium]
MKDFVKTQLALHKRAVEILAEYQKQKSMVTVCSEAIAQIEKGNNTYINTKEQFQASGDDATGKMMAMHLEYYEVLRSINEPIMFKELQINNARPMHMVEAAEMFYGKESIQN